MSFKAALRGAGGLVAAIGLSACTGRYQSDFPVIVVNRTANTIQVLANGNQIGQVAAGQEGSFHINLPETNANIFTNGVAPTPQADVVFSAIDLKTNAISATKSVTLTQNPPAYVTFNPADFPAAVRVVANFNSSPNNPGVNQDVFFNASSSTGTGLTYAWAFGDGTNGAGVMVTHQYSTASMFTVTLTVTSDSGATSTQSRTVNVSASLPPTAATFTFSPTNPATNQDVIFVASGVLPGVSFSWDFGDGSSGTGATVTHRYTRASTYNVMLRANNNLGQSATSSRFITVTGTLPAGSAAFTFSPTTPSVNDTVFFNASASTVANGTFRWDFGDGASAAGQTAMHQYTKATTYTVTLTVTNDVGQSATVSHTVTVSDAAFVVDFSFSPVDPTISTGTNTVIFDATPSGPAATSWTWDFGDGTSAGSGQRTTHTFTKAGTWVVRLTIADASGRTGTTTKNVTVKP